MRIVILWVAVWFASFHPAWAEQTPKDIQYNELSTYYYMHKDASKLDGYLPWLQQTHILSEHENAIPPITAFLTVIFQDNPTEVVGWVKSASFTGNTKKAIEKALWLSGNSKLIGDVFNETLAYENTSPVSLSSMELKRPGDLDMMWGAFFASGDVVYVKKIIDVLDNNTPLTGNKPADMATRASAEWSLGSNMMQHELVNRLVHNEIHRRSGQVKDTLEAIVARNEKSAKLFPNKDGDFSAMLALTDQKTVAAEATTPPNETMHIKTIEKVKKGDVIAIKLFFADMQLKEDLSADVTFDLKVLDPDGNIYDKTDLTNIVALQTKVATRTMIYDNANVVALKFDPQDKLGTYKIIAQLHDNVGKKNIPLSQTIELTQ